jgi:hypothetical protein
MSPTVNGPSTQPPQPLSSRFAARSPSPVVSTPPPGDTFHYGSCTPSVLVKQATNSAGAPRPGSPSSKMLKLSLPGDETWMQATLLKAQSQGFVWGDQDLSDALQDPTPPEGTTVDRHQLWDMILQLKTEHTLT